MKFFLLNSERGLWYDCRCGRFENFELASQFRIKLELSDSNLNLEASQVPRNLLSILLRYADFYTAMGRIFRGGGRTGHVTQR